MSLIDWIFGVVLVILMSIIWNVSRYWWQQKRIQHQLNARAQKTSGAGASGKTEGVVQSQPTEPVLANPQDPLDTPQVYAPLISHEPLVGPKRTAAHQTASQHPSSEKEYLEIRLLAQGQSIDGESLMGLAEEAGLSFNQKGILQKKTQRGVDFNLANLFAPGPFDPNNMKTFSTEGLVFFMLPIETNEPAQSFASMSDFIQKIALKYQATILNDQDQPLNSDDLWRYQQNLS